MTPDLRTQLGRVADATDPASDPIDLGELVSRRAARQRARKGPLVLRVAAGLLVVGVLAAVVAAVASDGDDAERIDSAVAPTASETADAGDPGSTRPTDPEMSDQRGGVAPEALDLLAPVDRGAFQSARSRLNRAVWETVEAEWSTCARAGGLVVDSELGYELSFLGNVAAYDFMAPSVIREQGGASRTASAAAAELTTEEVASIDRCNDRVQSVLAGQRPEADLDDSRLASARRALEILGSGASTFPRLHAEVERRVDMGEWGSVVECLRDRHLDVPDAAADSPTATLDVLGAAVDGSQSPAEIARLVTEARPRLEAYIDCAAAFYDDLSTELTRLRAEARGSNEPAFVELSAALDVLHV